MNPSMHTHAAQNDRREPEDDLETAADWFVDDEPADSSALHEIPADAHLIEGAAHASAQELTARPRERFPHQDEHYDAIFPEAVGAEWLARAMGLPMSEGEDDLELTDYAFLSSDVSAPVVSAGSRSASDEETNFTD